MARVMAGDQGEGGEGRLLLGLEGWLEQPWSLYPNARIPRAAGGVGRADGVLVGPATIWGLRVWTGEPPLELEEFGWWLEDGSWTMSPLAEARDLARDLRRCLRKAGWSGPLRAFGIVVLAREGKARHPARLEGGAPEALGDQVLTREELARWAQGFRGPSLNADRLSRAVERVIRGGAEMGETREEEETSRWRGGARSRAIEAPGRAHWWEAAALEQGLDEALPRYAAAQMDSELGLVQEVSGAVGPCLADWLRRQPGATREARFRIAIELARAMVRLHRQGLIHGWIGPWSVSVEDTHLEPRVEIEGVRLLARGGLPWARRREPGGRFLAPELLLGWGAATQASDQFGLGVVLSLLLHGSLPASSFELVERMKQEPGQDPVLSRLLAARPLERFACMAEALAALEQSQPGGKSPAAPLLRPPEHPDFEWLGWSHVGAHASLYQARHRESGALVLLKRAHPGSASEAAIRREKDTLRRLPHPRAPRLLGDGPDEPDGRPSFWLDWRPGRRLSELLREGHRFTEAEVGRMSHDLTDLLQSAHREGLVHLQIRPEHWIVGDDGHLSLIDWTGAAEAQPWLYRDPDASASSLARDRYAAAICLHELFTGRHPFGRPPAPDEEPALDAELFEGCDGGAMCGFFRKALHAQAESRFTSAREMKSALQAAQRFAAAGGGLVRPVQSGSELPPLASIEALGLFGAARAALRATGILTLGELASLTEAQLSFFASSGRRAEAAIRAAWRALGQAGGLGSGGLGARLEWPMFPGLGKDEALLETLDLSPGLRERLAGSGFRTVGALARHGRTSLRKLPGVGPAGVGRLLKALASRDAALAGRMPGPATLEELWSAMSSPLTGKERGYLEERFGLGGQAPKTGRPLARKWEMPGEGEPESRLLVSLAPELLGECVSLVEARCEALGRLELEASAAELERRWPGEQSVVAIGMARLMAMAAGLEGRDSGEPAARAERVGQERLGAWLLARAMQGFEAQGFELARGLGALRILLEWMEQGGLADELMLGILASGNLPRGIRALAPPTQMAEFRERIFPLVERTLDLLGRPVRRRLLRLASERPVGRAAGAAQRRPGPDWLPEEEAVVLEMRRLERCLAEEAGLAPDLAAWIERQAKRLAFAELCAARLRAALLMTSAWHREAWSLLEEYRQAHDRWNRAWLESLREAEPDEVERLSLGAGLEEVFGAGAPVAAWIHVPAASAGVVLHLLGQMAAREKPWTQRGATLRLALWTPGTRLPESGRAGEFLEAFEIERALAAPGSRLGLPELGRIGGLEGLLDRVWAQDARVLLTSDGGFTPCWPGAARLGVGGPARERVPGKRPAEGWVGLPGFPRELAWQLGTHRGQERAGYRGGASMAELLASIVVLEPGTGVPLEPGWWWEPAGAKPAAESAEIPPPSEPGEAEEPDAASKEAGPEQLSLPLMTSAPVDAGVPSLLDEFEEKALRLIARQGIANERDLEEVLEEPISRVLGRMVRLGVGLEARRFARASFEADARGGHVYRWRARELRAEARRDSRWSAWLALAAAGAGRAETLDGPVDGLVELARQEGFCVSELRSAQEGPAPPLSRLLEALGFGPWKAPALGPLLQWWLLEHPEPASALLHLGEAAAEDAARLLASYRRMLEGGELASAQALAASLGWRLPLEAGLRLTLTCARRCGLPGWLVVTEGEPSGWSEVDAMLRDSRLPGLLWIKTGREPTPAPPEKKVPASRDAALEVKMPIELSLF